MTIRVFTLSGLAVDSVELPTPVFEARINRDLMHQALVRQMANARQGNHKTKGRSEINKSTAKIYRQKGTGNARHGSRRAPIFVGPVIDAWESIVVFSPISTSPCITQNGPISAVSCIFACGSTTAVECIAIILPVIRQYALCNCTGVMIKQRLPSVLLPQQAGHQQMLCRTFY